VSALTNPHNFTLDSKTERIYGEFKDLARKEGKTLSEIIREFVTAYVESKNAKIVGSNPSFKAVVVGNRLTLLPIIPQDPYPLDKEAQEKWIKKYPRKTTVRYANNPTK